MPRWTKDNTKNFDRNFFKSIDSESKAYWLGFIAADGTIGKNRLTIALSSKDLSHLELFKIHIKSEHKITTKTYSHGYEVSTFSVNSKEIVEDLFGIGITKNKTLKLNFPSSDIVPPELIHHYIRGYSDGDGCWSYNRFSLISTLDFAENAQRILMENCELNKTKLTKRNPNVEVYTWGYRGRYQTKRIFEYLYKDANIFLERKRISAIKSQEKI